MSKSFIHEKCIIAELGMTHDGSFGQAKAMIKAASDCGVDAVKLQTHISEAETIRNAPTPPYFKAEPRYEYFKRTAFSKEQWVELREYSHECGVKFISSPFSIEAIDLLSDIDIDAYKIPSGEITNIPYLEHMAKSDKPIIVSSGMTSEDEVSECMDIFIKSNSDISILQCTSEYPCKSENVGLNVIGEYLKKYPGIPVGFSDHTSGVWASIAAFTMGARIIEKHFTLSKLMYGPDAKMSMDPVEMKLLCESINSLDRALKNPVDKRDISAYTEMRHIFQKSIVARIDIKKGTVISTDMLAYKKPGTGLETKYYKDLIGKRIIRDIRADEFIMREDIE